MWSSRGFVPSCFFVVFLFCCSPLPVDGRPPHSVRTRRSVSHAQLMHDKGRALQDFKRRMWLQELLDEVHTAEVRDLHPPLLPPLTPVLSHLLPPGPPTPGGGVSLHLDLIKPSRVTKLLPLSLGVGEEGEEEGDEEEGGGTNLPQETHKTQRNSGKKRKKGRGGRRREGEKRSRRTRSPPQDGEEGEEEDESSSGEVHRGWSSLPDLRGALLL